MLMTLKTITDKDIKDLRRVAKDEAAPSGARNNAISELGRLKDEKSLGILEKLTKDKELGHSAIWAVAEMGSPEAIKHLTAMLEEPTRDGEHFSLKLEAKDALQAALKKIQDELDPSIRGKVLGSWGFIEEERRKAAENRAQTKLVLKEPYIDNLDVSGTVGIGKEGKNRELNGWWKWEFMKEAEKALQEFKSEASEVFRKANKK